MKKPKCFGGLGLRESRNMNVTLLAKLVLALEHHKEKFWVQILVAKYLNGDSIFVIENCSNASYVWQGIVKVFNIFRDGFKFNMGSGDLSL